MKLDESVIKKALYESIDEMMGEDRTENADGTVEVDNFSEIAKLLQFKKPNDTIYFVQIIKRDKDNPRTKITI